MSFSRFALLFCTEPIELMSSGKLSPLSVSPSRRQTHGTDDLVERNSRDQSLVSEPRFNRPLGLGG